MHTYSLELEKNEHEQQRVANVFHHLFQPPKEDVFDRSSDQPAIGRPGRGQRPTRYDYRR